MQVPSIEVYSDGASSSALKHSAGGWAFCVLKGGTRQVIGKGSGGMAPTTNQRMELEGAMRGLEWVLENVDPKTYLQAKLVSDSKYVVGYVAEDWRYVWNQLSNWTNSAGKAVANKDLWERMEALLCRFEAQGKAVEFEWVRGHSTNEWNNFCDKWAVKEKEQLIGRLNKKKLAVRCE